MVVTGKFRHIIERIMPLTFQNKSLDIFVTFCIVRLTFGSDCHHPFIKRNLAKYAEIASSYINQSALIVPVAQFFFEFICFQVFPSKKVRKITKYSTIPIFAI